LRIVRRKEEEGFTRRRDGATSDGFAAMFSAAQAASNLALFGFNAADAAEGLVASSRAA